MKIPTFAYLLTVMGPRARVSLSAVKPAKLRGLPTSDNAGGIPNTTRWNLASKFGKYIAINMRCTFEFSPLIFHPQSLYSSRCRRSRQTLEGRNSRRRNSIKTRWNLTLKLGGLSKFICDRMYSIFPIGFSIGFGPTKPVFELGSSNPADFEARH